MHGHNVVHHAITHDYIFFRNDPIDIKLGVFEFSIIEKSSGVMKGHPAPEFCESRIRRNVSPDLFKAALRNVNYPDSRPFPSYGQPGDIWSAGVFFCELRLHPIPISLRFKETEAPEVPLAAFISATSQPEFLRDDSVFAKTMGLPMDIPHGISFLRKPLDPNPQTRHTAESCLADQWLNDSGTQDTDHQHASTARSRTKRRRMAL